jgi:biopolymer transport protein ExbB/TolQ
MNPNLDALTSILYQVSNALFVPVLLAVLLLFAVVLVILGGFVRECFDRRAIRRALRDAVAKCDQSPPKKDDAWSVLAAVKLGLPSDITCGEEQLWRYPHRLRKRLRDIETGVTARLARLSFLTRVGPILGLLGTLIPFGPALAGLSTGDVRTLSANLVAAFATTVVGLLSGCLAFGVGLVRKGWYSCDLNDLEYIGDRLLGEEQNNETQAAGMGDGRGRSDSRVAQPV